MLPLFNHLWQSTLFAGVAGLLTLLLRKNRAQARHALWLIASVKFLVPFSLLIAIGSHLGWPTAPAIAPSGFSAVIEQIGQPFLPPQIHTASSPAVLASKPNVMPAVLLMVWLCGCTVVLLRWCASWRRITATLRAALPIHEGRDLEALRRLELIARIAKPIELVSSMATLEPGIFGIFRPVLFLPAGISDHLAEQQLEAIIAHELCHVRRRDNLAAAIHMLVEAIFWFHPLVWWLGARLVEERERACDEDVLRLGSEPHIYAESILKTCQFYLESPLACMSGVTGSDLKKRIVHIMTQPFTNNLDLRKKLLLAIAGMAAVAGPIIFGLLNAPQGRAQSPTPSADAAPPAFEVASIKPNKAGGRGLMIRNGPARFNATDIAVRMLIHMAYGIQDFQISGGPAWLNSDRFDIEAKTGGPPEKEPWKLNEEQRKAFMERRRLMMQALLADRFQLKTHRETKELPVYALVVAKNGPKLKEDIFTPTADMPGPDAKPDARPEPKEPKGPMFTQGPGPGQMSKDRPMVRGEGMRMGPGQLSAQAVPLSNLVEMLSNTLGRTVIDKTGLKKTYDFTLQWTPDESQGQMFKGAARDGGPGGPGPGGPDGAPPPDAGPSIFTAIQEQLGLKLESQKGPVEILVIDSVEKPTEN
jgi:uncharacterized protein (TIGR03435 family)